MKNLTLLSHEMKQSGTHCDAPAVSEAFIRVCRTLCRLGITANYTGFYYTAYAAALAAENPERLQLVTKWLYPDVAVKYGTSSDAVRKNIRKVCDLVWENNPELLSEIAMHKLKKKPETSEFLAMIVVFLFF